MTLLTLHNPDSVLDGPVDTLALAVHNMLVVFQDPLVVQTVLRCCNPERLSACLRPARESTHVSANANTESVQPFLAYNTTSLIVAYLTG